jgi:hypothetical protein
MTSLPPIHMTRNTNKVSNMMESKVQYDVHHLSTELEGQRKVLAS